MSSVIKYDSGATATYEGDVRTIAGRIEGIIGDREAQRNFVAENYESTDNDADYDAIEKKWIDAADAVKAIVDRARELMEENDDTALTHHNRAGTAIRGMSMM